ncbi:MAG TPA: hypothetical protein VLH83_05260 [Chthoniobacterales bacterium]|nr:hypothetical protein [Chthoniobacterales bacterium]
METIPSRRANVDRPRFPWRVLWVLLMASLVGVASLFPYLLALFQKIIAARPWPIGLEAAMPIWKRGFEAAMLAHFSADFTLHVIGPMFFRG